MEIYENVSPIALKHKKALQSLMKQQMYTEGGLMQDSGNFKTRKK